MTRTHRECITFYPKPFVHVSIRLKVLQDVAEGYTPGWGRRAITKTRALVGSCSIALRSLMNRYGGHSVAYRRSHFCVRGVAFAPTSTSHYQNRGQEGIEPSTSPTLRENHTTRPLAHCALSTNNHMRSEVAQRKRVGLITQRSVDRNHPSLYF